MAEGDMMMVHWIVDADFPAGSGAYHREK